MSADAAIANSSLKSLCRPCLVVLKKQDIHPKMMMKSSFSKRTLSHPGTQRPNKVKRQASVPTVVRIHKIDSAGVSSPTKQNYPTVNYLKEHLESCRRVQHVKYHCQGTKGNKQGVTTLSESLSELVMSFMEDDVLAGFQLLSSFLHTGAIPDAKMMGLILHDIFQCNKQAGASASGVLRYLHNLAMLHPPLNIKARSYYFEMLSSMGEKEQSVWKMLIGIIKRSLSLEKEKEQEVTDHSLAFVSFIVDLMETDFRCFLERSLDVRKDISSIRNCPLVAKIMWSTFSSTGTLNRQINELFGILHNVLELKIPKTKKVLHLDAVQGILGLVAECCRYSYPHCSYKECCRNRFVTPFVNTLLCTVAGALRKEDTLSLFLNSIKHHWLLLMVSEWLLKQDHAKRGIEKGDDFDREISLQKIVNNYVIPPPYQSLKMKHLKALSTPLKTLEYKNQIGDGVNKRNLKGETPLHRAIISNNMKRFKQLLCSPNVDINAADNLGFTPLHEAAITGNLECIKDLLLWRDAEGHRPLNVSPVAERGLTPFHDAVIQNHVQVAELLLKFGGEKLLHEKMVDGKMAKDLARSSQMKVLLEKYSHHETASLTPADNGPDPVNAKDEQQKQMTTIFRNEKEAVRYMLLVDAILTSYFTVHKISHILEKPKVLLRTSDASANSSQLVSSEKDIDIALLKRLPEKIKQLIDCAASVTSSDGSSSDSFQVYVCTLTLFADAINHQLGFI